MVFKIQIAIIFVFSSFLCVYKVVYKQFTKKNWSDKYHLKYSHI
jgi:hypothetical protein